MSQSCVKAYYHIEKAIITISCLELVSDSKNVKFKFPVVSDIQDKFRRVSTYALKKLHYWPRFEPTILFMRGQIIFGKDKILKLLL